MPELLELPEGEKRGDDWIFVGVGEQEVAEAAHGVVLDVVHVAKAPQRVGVEWVPLDLAEVEVATSRRAARSG